jgi:hypothetical protein
MGPILAAHNHLHGDRLIPAFGLFLSHTIGELAVSDEEYRPEDNQSRHG